MAVPERAVAPAYVRLIFLVGIGYLESEYRNLEEIFTSSARLRERASAVCSGLTDAI